jgi:hypothetical protein
VFGTEVAPIINNVDGGDVLTGQADLVSAIAEGSCTLDLNYIAGSGSEVIASVPYTFPSEIASFVPAGTVDGDSVNAQASVFFEQPVDPEDGDSSWFGFVVPIAASAGGCPSTASTTSGAAWVGDVQYQPGSESGLATTEWSVSKGTLDWCGYIDGPGTPGGAAGLLVGQSSYTPSALPTTPTTSKPTTSTPTKSSPTPKYTLTVATAKTWADSAIDDQFYKANYKTKLTGLKVSDCEKLQNGRVQCAVAWTKAPYSYKGTTQMGSLNAETGRFRFQFTLTRTTTATGAKKRLSIPY